MQEIIYRAWKESIQEMIPFSRLGMGAFNDEDYQMMRYINVDDKNGKKIFQKDICKYYNDKDKDGIGIIEDDYIKWISGTIAKTNLMTPLYYLKCGSEFEVTGNIYENPELLKQGRVVSQESESMSR
jgi:uncharacterized phage protein (TIGR01671 family)